MAASKTLDYKEQFIQHWAPLAMALQQKYGVPASVTLGQAALESDWGRDPVRPGNFFGIKNARTGRFMSFGNIESSFIWHARLLSNPSSHVYHTQGISSTNWQRYLASISRSGYCEGSSSTYYNRVSSIISSMGLSKYDTTAVKDAQTKGIKIGYLKGSGQNVDPHPYDTLSDWTSNDLDSYSMSSGYGHGQTMFNKEANGYYNTNNVPTEYRTPLEYFPDRKWSMPIGSKDLSVAGLFGEKRPSHHHAGIDIQTGHQHIPCYATEDNGKVVTVADRSHSGGPYVVVQYHRPDGEDIQCVYMHLSRIDVKQGDSIHAGQQIGVTGTAGTGPHLHFEVYRFPKGNSKGTTFVASARQDPVKYLTELGVRMGTDVNIAYKGDKSMDLTDKYSKDMSLIDPNSIPQTELAKAAGTDDNTKKLEYLLGDQLDKGTQANGLFEYVVGLIGDAFGMMIPMVLSSSMQSQMAKEEEEAKKTEVSADNKNTLDTKSAKETADKLGEAARIDFSDYEQTQQQQQQLDNQQSRGQV